MLTVETQNIASQIQKMSENKFKNIYRISSARLANWDYGSDGLYFVTICTQNHECYFGHITVKTQNIASLQETEIGKIAYQNWIQIPQHFPFIELDEFILMPNHIHGILNINNPSKKDWLPNQFEPQSKNIPSVIRGFKASVKKYATINNLEFSWQPRYYDRIIRDNNEFLNIRQYIIDNPINWDNLNRRDAKFCVSNKNEPTFCVSKYKDAKICISTDENLFI